MSASLASSLEQAGEGSRELDAEIADLFDPVPDQHDGFQGRWPFVPGSPYSDQTPPVTTSIDAALALAERVLPGWFISLERYSDGWYATVCDHSTNQRRFQGSQKPAALALCLAILKATNPKGQPNV